MQKSMGALRLGLFVLSGVTIASTSATSAEPFSIFSIGHGSAHYGYDYAPYCSRLLLCEEAIYRRRVHFVGPIVVHRVYAYRHRKPVAARAVVRVRY